MNSDDVSQKGYQAISSEGSVVSGNDRSYLRDIIFDSDMEGRSVLDIGSSQGYFCLEALKRGARRAVGVEPLPQNVQSARAIATKAGLEAEYLETDFESWDTDEKFDTILCLNVLHHMYDPIHVLRKIVDMAQDKIVIEFAAPRLRDVWNKRISFLAFLLRREAALIMGRPRHPKDSVRIAEYTFMFTPNALRTFFNTHYSCFEPVSVIRSPFKGRMIAVIRRRKIHTITVVAGPTSAGKSTFVKRLLDSPELRKELGIPEKIDAEASYRLYHAPAGEPLNHVVLHYDILRPFGRAIRTHERDPVLSTLRNAKKVNILTLKVASEQLIRQITTGEPASSSRHQQIKKLYADPGFLSLWYSSWENFARKLPNSRLLTLEQHNGEFRLSSEVA